MNDDSKGRRRGHHRSSHAKRLTHNVCVFLRLKGGDRTVFDLQVKRKWSRKRLLGRFGHMAKSAERNGILALHKELVEFHLTLFQVEVRPHRMEIIRHVRAPAPMTRPGQIGGCGHIPIDRLSKQRSDAIGVHCTEPDERTRGRRRV